MDHEASKNQSSISGAGSRNKDDQKFMSLVENLSKIESARGQNNQSDPIGVFLNKQIEVLVSDFEYQEKKFDSKFALMQKVDRLCGFLKSRKETGIAFKLYFRKV